MDRTVEAAKAQVDSGKAKLDYANSNLELARKMFQTKTATQDQTSSPFDQVQAGVEYQQDLLMLRATEAMQAATALLPTGVQQYIDRKGLTHDVLKMQLAEAEVRLKQTERDRNRGEIRSPIEGVVLERAISDERQLTAGTLLLKIGRLEDLEVEADILSQDVVNVKEQDPVEISGPASAPTGRRNGKANLSGRLHESQLAGRGTTTGEGQSLRSTGRFTRLRRNAIWASTTACAFAYSPPKKKTPSGATIGTVSRRRWQMATVCHSRGRAVCSPSIPG